MNSRKIRSAFIVMLLIGIMTVTGCATWTKKTGVERAEKTTTSMQTIDSDIKQASLQIDNTRASLNDLIRTGQSAQSRPADVKKSFKTYSENVAKMEDIGRKLNKHIDQMNSKGNTYFEEWEKTGGTYSDPKLQKLSAEQRVRLSNSFTNIAMTSAGMRDALNRYLSEIRQIQKFLYNDLNLRSISTVASVEKTVEKDGDNLKKSFEPVQTAISQTKIELTPEAAAAGGTGHSPEGRIK